MKITLAYDRHGLEVELPDRNVKAVLRKPAAVPLENAGEALRAGLRSPIGTGALSEIARGKRNAVIVVSDVTRPVPNATILPPIIETLTEAGVAREAITILVATGLHGPNEGAVLDQVLGAEIAGSMNVANHDARAREAHTYLGTTACGTEVRIDSRYRNADVKVLTGLIEPHFMAGYSGGPKAILPGLAAADAIGVIHGYRMLADARCRTGNITDNPLREELIAAARMA
ncbi:MAG: lactate racemase domain-containing protein, partial [Candidatus Brocadiia bacterium]|nr:lactate racemase domain-containing protein [Candidatus Brocadiia bacterium]